MTRPTHSFVILDASKPLRMQKVRNISAYTAFVGNGVIYSGTATDLLDPLIAPVKTVASATAKIRARVAGIVTSSDIAPGAEGLIVRHGRAATACVTGTVTAHDWLQLCHDRAGAMEAAQTALLGTAFATALEGHSGGVSNIAVWVWPWRY